MKNLNLNEVEAAKETGSGSQLKPGGYIVKVTSATDVTDKEYLFIEYDIAAGDFKGYYDNMSKTFGFWGGNLYRSYKTSALPFFKSFISAIEKSNNGYVFDYDEKTLIGKVFGAILQSEEYYNKSGELKTRLICARTVPIKDIAENNYVVPPLKKAGKPITEQSAKAYSISDEDLPF